MIELSQYVKFFDPEVSQKVSIMLRYLNKSKFIFFHRNPSNRNRQMGDSKSDRIRNRNSIPISESEIKIQRAKIDKNYGKVAKGKIILFLCYISP